MLLYRFMHRLPWPTSYVGRILALCFVGTHVPLIALTVFELEAQSFSDSLRVITVVLAATLLGTALTSSLWRRCCSR
ncbi:hypothetical protein [Jiella sp. M17.18]|uniref:hypothetical protein n=1 Tax=Jiella sp. M17.18 TaxID=3234247 RepID=UPI0034DF7622